VVLVSATGDYRRALTELGRLGRFGMRLGLDTMTRVCARLGSPERAFPVLHIAGTNGKGSTSHALHSILRAAGWKVGLYTSPHILRFTERITVGGRELDRARVLPLYERVREAAGDAPMTFFEAATAMAFSCFAEERVDAAVVEVGLGGRLDATNVVHPLVSIITSIGLEHREHLGTTESQIALEKAGIVKGGRPVIVGPLSNEAERAIQRVAAERGAPLHRWGRELIGLREERAREGERFWYRGQTFRGRFTVPLFGAHQVANASLAAYAAELAAGFGLSVHERHVAEGLAVTRVPGRFQEVEGRPTIVLDTAHNPGAARVLAGSLADRFGAHPVALVIGVLADKDHLEMLHELAPAVSEVCVVRPESDRARDPEDVVVAAREVGLRARAFEDMASALDAARAAVGEGGGVVVTGSFYTVAMAMKVLGIGGEHDPIVIGDAVRIIEGWSRT
jgi:dihydrofolate synthase/folylpolyglutamate synthase